ncbi:membrane protein [Streptomyces alboflavus]|uniref:Membrane protein n=2 Tax=Streptomyces TaxID=1883 RepID=A0A1Z1WCN8_9ACTN|nr:membrane protein [Streptomyces alboflavus]
MRMRWPMAMGVNVLLGIPGVVPVWLLWYFAANWPFAALGWTQGEPTENDGMLPWFLVGVPVVGAFALVWWLVNLSVRRRAGSRPGLYWPLSVLATLAPSFVLMAVL